MGEISGNPDSNISFVEQSLRQALINPQIDKLDLNFAKNSKISDDFSTNYVDGIKLLSKGRKNSGKWLDEYCLEAMEKEYPRFKTKYKDYLKAFYFGLISAENKDGYSIKSSAFVYGDAQESTAAHEWLHSMGLPHTFSGKGEFTYEVAKTENIMDYTHALSRNELGPIKGMESYSKSTFSLYHWQWKIVHNSPLTQKEE